MYIIPETNVKQLISTLKSFSFHATQFGFKKVTGECRIYYLFFIIASNKIPVFHHSYLKAAKVKYPYSDLRCSLILILRILGFLVFLILYTPVSFSFVLWKNI